MSEKPLILDGGLGTLLYSRGVFVKGDPLWSVRCLVMSDESEGRRQLLQAHLDYLAAGADIIKTNSYQMSMESLQKCLPVLSQEESLELMKDSVHIARNACHLYWQSIGEEKSGRRKPMVAGSIGPYGACKADMSEYNGNYVDSINEEDLIQWHRPRLMALLQAGVDYLAFETFPALLEARAILKLLKQEAPDIPAWISFSCKDGKHLCHGETFDSALKQIWMNKTPGLKAIGINCTPERLIEPLLRSLDGADHIPIILYPNREDSFENEGFQVAAYPIRHENREKDGNNLSKLAKQWLSIHSNVFALGGCCFFHPTEISNLRHDFGN